MGQNIFFHYDPADVYFFPAAWSSNYLFHFHFGIISTVYLEGNYLFQQLAAANYLLYHLLALSYLFQKYPSPPEIKRCPPLAGRTQIVGINGLLSDPLLISTGVPQRSILAPLPFIVYTNGLPGCLSHCDCNMYMLTILLSTLLRLLRKQWCSCCRMTYLLLADEWPWLRAN